MIGLNGVRVAPTRFPDGTTQVWHLGETLINGPPYRVLWQYEQEAELVTLLQLLALLYEETGRASDIEVYVPYLPWARQDHEVADDKCFALRPFLSAVHRYKALWHFLDPHPPREERILKRVLHNRFAPDHAAFIKEHGYDAVILPDEGASRRYGSFDVVTYIGSKTREPATGKIVAHTLPKLLPNADGNPPRNVLMIDDLCDGGASFEGLAKQIHEQSATTMIDLFVTHGIFSRGLWYLLEGGFDRIITTNSFHAKLNDPAYRKIAREQNPRWIQFDLAIERGQLVVLDALDMMDYPKAQEA